MGKFEIGTVGDFHGKVGNVTIVKRGSKMYAVKNQCTHTKRTFNEDQIAHQQRFRDINALLKPFKTAMRAGFYTGDAAHPVRAQAFRTNYRKAEEGGDFHVGAEMLQLSRGGESLDIDVVKNREGGYDATWTPVDGDSPLDGGKVYVVVYNAKTAKAETFRSEMSAGSMTVSAAGIMTGAEDEIHIYAFAARRTASSDTRHFSFD
jgi:nitrite reductase/ring-hydroxylating ferredoxin subunit